VLYSSYTIQASKCRPIISISTMYVGLLMIQLNYVLSCRVVDAGCQDVNETHASRLTSHE